MTQHSTLTPVTQCFAPSPAILVALECVPYLVKGDTITTAFLSDSMTRYYGGTDASGAWNWKHAYDAVECALILFLQRYRPALSKLKSERLLATLERLHGFCPTQTKRSEASQKLQQFSTPATIGLLATIAADIDANDIVLEPSAGTGMLAVLSYIKGASLILNELCHTRASLLSELFEEVDVTRHNAEYIDDLLAVEKQPSVIIMNPPFSSSPNGSGFNTQITMQHIQSALHRLPEKGRLVAITGESFSPYTSKWRGAFDSLSVTATLQESFPLAGSLYYKHGTTVDTRIHVFDKVPSAATSYRDDHPVIASPAEALTVITKAMKYLPRLDRVKEQPPVTVTAMQCDSALTSNTSNAVAQLKIEKKAEIIAVDSSNDGVYLPYHTQILDIAGAKAHPSPLVESAALASVAPPYVDYRPTLYTHLVTDGVLSEAQLESITYAGSAHSDYLEGYFTVDNNGTDLHMAAKTDDGARQYRKGWYLGDGTGCGKGRQVAGIILDNWLQGRKRAIWVSKSDKLVEDARRDWVALGGNELDIIPQSKFKLGDALTLPEGILFTTYATLRTSAKGKKRSRLEQITDWLGDTFDGCVMFDESHAMANAMDVKGDRGMKNASQQGLCGLKLQYGLPDARIVYVSATGATTVSNLAYATRLGLWSTTSMPFTSQSDFIAEMERGGIAAMEVIARDLKSMGLYLARSLSYEGVEYDFLNHDLSDEQIAIYDAYAEAFQVIHQNIDAALEATNITGKNGVSQNSTAKAAARGAFESNKQRFFNHLLMSMKCPSLIKAIESDIEEGRAAVIQVVSTNEAMMERRLADIPADEWQDLQVDITPREYVFDYLMHAFPVYLYEVFTDEEGKQRSEIMRDHDSNPVVCRAALAKRDELVEKLATLPAIPGALDQIIQHFGHEQVAEATGRSRRIVKIEEAGVPRYAIQNRPASANTAETHAFMDGKKNILIFSDAGGTGRSYHADRDCVNQRRRVHYLLEAGWRADTAIQGLGRTNRTNQSSTPIFRPVASDVKGEKRFLSTIARRLDTLGAMTKGQRETGSQGLFRAEDNLESDYARTALRNLLRDISYNRVNCCTLHEFEERTGLKLMTDEGTLKQDLPPISQFLNRLLALPIALQNDLFDEFELRIQANIQLLMEAGLFETGVAMLKADSFRLVEQTILYDYDNGQASTLCNHIIRKDSISYPTGEYMLSEAQRRGGALVRNAQSSAVAYQTTKTVYDEEAGHLVEKVKLQRPSRSDTMTMKAYNNSQWDIVDAARFVMQWDAEVAVLPKQRESELYLISGVLLPVWKRMPKESAKVCRLVTDDGISLLGREVEPSAIAEVFTAFGLDATQMQMKPVDILARVRDSQKPTAITPSLALRNVRVMHERRLEVTGYDAAQHEQLKAAGCISEMIAYKMRYFVPDNDSAIDIITRLQALV